jgi:hypothetical protein
MLNKLKSFIGMIHHTVKKEDVIKYMENTINTTSNEVIPVLEKLISSYQLDSISNNDILNNIGVAIDIKFKDNKDVLMSLKTGFVNIVKAESKIENAIEKNMKDIITNKTITAREIAIMKIITDISSMNIYILDLLYKSLLENPKDELTKKELKNIENGMYSFTTSFKTYGDKFTTLLKDIYKVSNDIINIDDSDLVMVDTMLSKNGKKIFLPSTNGFVYNPIYHIRIWYIDREMDKYENLKFKKRRLEAKITELELKQRNENSTKLANQIEYYNDQITKVSHKIEKIENND